MGLSEYEQTVLRRLDADLDREDPRLRRLLNDFRPPGLETPGAETPDCAAPGPGTPGPAASDPGPSATWRPPRAAVVLAAVLLAGATFMLTGLTLVTRQPCPAAATPATTEVTGSSRTSGPAGERPAPSAPDRDPAAARPSAPSTC